MGRSVRSRGGGCAIRRALNLPGCGGLLLAMVVGAALLVHLSARPRWHRLQETRLLMGTQVDVTVLVSDHEQGDRGLRACFGEMERIQALMNIYSEGSQISKLNRLARQQWVVPHPEVFWLVQRSLESSRASDGAFDISVGPLVRIWREARRRGVPPSTLEVQAALAHVGYTTIDVDPKGQRLRFLNEGMSLDLGGIAKGYALDKGAEALRREGIQQALLNAGGDILALGGKGKDPWIIGIRDPRDPNGLLGSLEARDVAVITSGDYERFFVYEGKRYHHILDPRTGFPSRGCRSVTVVGPRATEADALATAAFVMGPSSGLALLEHRPGVEGIVVDERGRKSLTSGLEGKVKWLR